MAGLSLLGLFLGLGPRRGSRPWPRPFPPASLASPKPPQPFPPAFLSGGAGHRPGPLPPSLAPNPQGYLVGTLLSSLGAQVLLAPLLLHRFGFLPLLSPFSNLLALPLVALLVPLGVLKLLLGASSPPWWSPWPSPSPPGPACRARPPVALGGDQPRRLCPLLPGPFPLFLALFRLLPGRRALLLTSLPLLLSLLSSWPKPLDLWALDVGQGTPCWPPWAGPRSWWMGGGGSKGRGGAGLRAWG